jgi:hypothetical protein
MPQVDLATFLPQIFWLVLLFGLAYTYIIRSVLFVIYSTMFIRSKLLQYFVKLNNFLSGEYTLILSNYIKYFNTFLQQIFTEVSFRLNLIETFLVSVTKTSAVIHIYGLTNKAFTLFFIQRKYYKLIQ